MKSAYEIAMERLNKSSPTVKLTDAQKKEFAELDSKFEAKIAEREISLRGEITRLAERGEMDKAAELEAQLAFERKKLQTELEEKKEQLRGRKPAR
jgi:hypothetical protein